MYMVIIKKKKRKVKVMSFNIRSCQDCQLDNIINYLGTKKSDIICLQEVDIFSKYCPVNICDLIKEKLGFNYKYLKTIDRKVKGQYGICIFSKYPIIEYEEYYYHNYNEKRGLQRIKVFIPKLKEEYNIFNTHLDYKHNRDLQVKECLDIIDKYNSNCILCGDLNLNPTEEIYNKLTEKFREINYSNTYSAKRPKQILDYILINKNNDIKYKYMVDDVILSDHKPLICYITKKK